MNDLNHQMGEGKELYKEFNLLIWLSRGVKKSHRGRNTIAEMYISEKPQICLFCTLHVSNEHFCMNSKDKSRHDHLLGHVLPRN